MILMFQKTMSSTSNKLNSRVRIKYVLGIERLQKRNEFYFIERIIHR